VIIESAQSVLDFFLFGQPQKHHRTDVAATTVRHDLMKRTATKFILVFTAALLARPASALITGITGSGLPNKNIQPSLGINYIVRVGGTNFDDLGEIVPFAGNFAPRDWHFAHGTLLAIIQNQVLFAKLCAFYGGNGQITFALPNLWGRTSIGAGQGPGLEL
jgi:microcystin-dependent protein